MTRMEILELCDKYKITNYTINNDGSIDVDGDVYLGDTDLTELPLMFNKVRGNFGCNYLTSLVGCPKEVGGNFFCNSNYLTSLVGCPKYVGGQFSCSDNQLKSLEGCPEYVGGDFYCGDNYLTSFDGCPREVGGVFYCYDNNLSDISYDPLFEAGIDDIYCRDSDDIIAIRRQWVLNGLINE